MINTCKRRNIAADEYLLFRNVSPSVLQRRNVLLLTIEDNNTIFIFR